MQGWAPDFIPKLTEDAVAAGHRSTGSSAINGAEALRLSRELARREGIFCGITGGATLAGGARRWRRSARRRDILCMLPDTGERYLSTPLFEDIRET